jgi:hypothetical protein
MKSGILLTVLLLLPLVPAQCQTQNLPIGTIINPISVTCPFGYISGAACTQVTVTGCPGAADLSAIVGYKQGSKGIGTVALLSGASGTLPMNLTFANDYNKFGLDVIQRNWLTAWETVTPRNILVAACREATLINYEHSISREPFRIQGKSAGSAAIVYALVWYSGIANLVSHVSLLAGPPLSDIQQGCEVPLAGPITVEPTDGASFTNAPQYVPPFTSTMTTFTGQTCLPSSNTSNTADTAWLSQSIIQPGVVASFPNFTIAGWVCNNQLNNTAAQSQIFFNSLVNTSYTLTAITNCQGAEGVEQGTTPEGIKGQKAVEQEMESN